LSFLLVPMRQPTVEVRPIVQLTGTSEFNEVFFTRARTAVTHAVGEVGGGWAVAMATLGVERGVATIGQQVRFHRELERIVARAVENGAIDDALIRDRLTQAWIGLQVMRAHALRTLRSGNEVPGAATGGAAHASIAKLLWARWHRGLGELAVDVEGVDGLCAADPPYDLTDAQRLFLFTRADTIYGGSDEVQRTILAERVLGLPREARS
jgi:alkylation response protein AidB-like acyl-CoA dehydrogenase